MAGPRNEILWLNFCIAVQSGDPSSIFIYSQWFVRREDNWGTVSQLTCNLLFSPLGKQIKRSTQDVLSMRITMDRPLLRIPCTTQTQKLLRGKSSASTPISTPSAPWFDVCWVWKIEGEGGSTTPPCLLNMKIYRHIYTLSVSDDIQQRHRIAQKHKAQFQQHLTTVAIDHKEKVKD